MYGPWQKLAMHGPCMASHAWLIHDSRILVFNVFFNLIPKLRLYCREIIPFLLLFCYLLVVISWENNLSKAAV